MADQTVLHPLHAVTHRLTRPAGAAVEATILPRPSIALAMAHPGQAERLANALAAWRTPAPGSGPSGAVIFPVAPGRHMVAAPQDGDGRLAASLSAHLPGIAHVCDQSHALVAVRLAGPAALTTLAKGCGLDLDGLAAGTGLWTRLEAFPVGLHRDAAGESYLLLVRASAAESFWHWLEEATEEFGLAADMAT